MRKVEFFGFSGVGKTTLYNKVFTYRTSNDLWVSPEEALVDIVKANFTTKNLLSRRGLLKLNIFTKYYLKWSREILHSNRWKTFSIVENYNEWLSLFVEAFHIMDSTAREKIEFTDLFHQLIKDYAFLEYYEYEKTVVFNEGLFQCNPGLELLPNYKDFVYKKRDIYISTASQGVVFCKLPAEENFKRRIKRINEGNPSLLEKLINDDILMKECIEGEKSMLKRMEIIRETGLNILELDMSEHMDSNVEKVVLFINEISKGY